ncbi:MAG: hypothetical protein JWM11_5679 [Planctomycetaceae bacterium]|nr:hypothetical protein [Planctomycetaceae bacterium]
MVILRQAIVASILAIVVLVRRSMVLRPRKLTADLISASVMVTDPNQPELAGSPVVHRFMLKVVCRPKAAIAPRHGRLEAPMRQQSGRR